MGSKIASLIVDVAADTAALRQGMDKATSTVEGFASKAQSALGMFGVSLGAAAVVSFGKEMIENASRIQDMADKLGIGTTAVQRFTNAAEMGGGSMEDVGKSIGKMNVNLAGGSNSTKEALAAAGLGFDKIKNMSPEKAFEAIADGVSSIEDPFKRAEAARALFGKGADALLPTLAAIKHTSDAGLISPENIKALDDLGDSFTSAMQKGKALGGWFAGGFVRDIQSGQGWVEQTYLKLTLGSKGAEEAMKQQAAMSTATAKQHEEAEKKKQEALAKSAAEFEKTTAATKKKEDADKAAAAAAKQHADAVKKLAETYSGKTDIQDAKLALEGLAAAHINVKNVALLDTDQQKALNKTMDEAIAVYTRHGQVAPQAMRDLYIATIQLPPVVHGIGDAFKYLGDTVNLSVLPPLDQFKMKVEAGLPSVEGIGIKFTQSLLPAHTHTKNLNAEIGKMTQSLTQLATIGGDTFDGIARGIATALSAGQSLNTGIGSLKLGMKDMKTDGLAGFLEMSSGIMGMASAAIQVGQIVKQVWDKIFGSAGRDLVKDYVATFTGGFDGPGGIHEALLKGGDAGEALWVKLTQGVGKNNPQQAKAVIAEVQAFLDALGKTNVSPRITPQIDWPNGEQPDGIDVPGFASGVRNFRGGMAVVGESGPELVSLPRGSNVYPNGTGPSGVSFTVNVAENGSGGPGWAITQGEIIGKAVQAYLAQNGIRR